MEKLFLVLVLCVVVKATHKHHPKFPKNSEEFEPHLFKKVACTSEYDEERNSIIEKAQCGDPKDVFVHLEKRASYEDIRPAAVWVKKCVGLCDYGKEGSQCVPTKVVTRHIPVRIYNVRTNKETCSTYPIEEHLQCGCCSQDSADCPAPKVYNPQDQEYEVEPI